MTQSHQGKLGIGPADGHAGVCRACATPDFHPGAIAPVGSVVATPADFVIPSSIGTDINCGMRLLTTGLGLGQLAPHKDALVKRLTRSLLDNGRDVPVSTRAFTALFDDGPDAFLDRLDPLGLWAQCDRERLRAEVQRCVGLASFAGHSRRVPAAYRSDARRLPRSEPGHTRHRQPFRGAAGRRRRARPACGLRRGAEGG